MKKRAIVKPIRSLSMCASEHGGNYSDEQTDRPSFKMKSESGAHLAVKACFEFPKWWAFSREVFFIPTSCMLHSPLYEWSAAFLEKKWCAAF
jgi:hypothetical protein